MASQAEVTERRRRLVLRVTTRRDVETGLPASVEIATALRSELATLFVTDDALFAASGLPFPAMISFAGGPLALDPGRFEAALRREAEQCRQLLAAAAERARLTWSFQSKRGESMRLVQEACAGDDILVIGIDRLGLPAAEAIALARELAPDRGGVMLVPERAAPRQGSVVMLESPKQAAAAFSTFAATLADALGTSVVHVDPLAPSSSSVLASARLLLAPVEGPPLDDDAVIRRLAGLRAPLLLLRTEAVSA
jgi:hypothetical protein